MVMRREVGEVRLQLRADLGLLVEGMALPVRAARAVPLDEAALAVEHEIREASALERADRLGLQQRRLLVPRIELRERMVRAGRVLPALLLDVEVAEIHVDDVRVRTRADAGQRLLDRRRAVEIRERDRPDP